MLTGRGWTLTIGAALALGGGYVFGLPDLSVAGIGLALLVGASWGYAGRRRSTVEATRHVYPLRVHAGAVSRVELTITNRAAKRSPVLGVRDPFDGGVRWARLRVAPLAPKETARAAYRLSTEHRGIYRLGPLQALRSDPFGIVASSTVLAPEVQLTVYPRVELVAALPTSGGEDPLAGSEHPHALSGGGEDFYALRPYVRGDDLRRVHWPSVARTGELMIRQDEMPWQGRATVVVDTRAERVSPIELERSLSAATSIVLAGWRRRSLLRLLTTSGFDSGFAEGHEHLDTILEHLAGAFLGPGSLFDVLAGLGRSGSGALAVITSEGVPPEDLSAVGRLHGSYGTPTLVLIASPPLRSSAPEVPGTQIVRVSDPPGFATAWNAAVAARSHRAAPMTRTPMTGTPMTGMTP